MQNTQKFQVCILYRSDKSYNVLMKPLLFVPFNFQVFKIKSTNYAKFDF